MAPMRNFFKCLNCHFA